MATAQTLHSKYTATERATRWQDREGKTVWEQTKAKLERWTTPLLNGIQAWSNGFCQKKRNGHKFAQAAHVRQQSELHVIVEESLRCVVSLSRPGGLVLSVALVHNLIRGLADAMAEDNESSNVRHARMGCHNA